MSDAQTGPAALEVAGLVKSFREQRALDGVSLTVRRAEIHGLLGENGSGKSTLIKILCGYHRPDAGELRLGGTRVPLPLNPGVSGELGMQFVHQDLGLIPTMTVAENFALLALSRGTGEPSERSMCRRASEVLGRYGVDLDPRAAVSTLAAVDRALLAIVRAVDALAEGGSAQLTRLLVLDEPTVYLPRKDVERVFDLARSLVAEGCAIVLVSHDLDEVLELTDRVTVLRDGQLVGTRDTAQCSRDDLVDMIVGRRLAHAERPADTPVAAGPVAFQVVGLTGRVVRDVSFSVQAGEIVGLAGLGGSGYEEICYLLYGARRAHSGELSLGSQVMALPRMSPHRALAAGIAFLPADRRRTAGIGSLSVDDNITQPRLARFRRPAGLDRRAMRRDTVSLMDRFDVRPRDPEHAFGTLSGGNQQKALLAKWLSTEPQLVLIDEPTQGVDVGARQQIFAFLRAMAATGRSVLCSSTDHEQLAMLTDRTIVFGRGRVVSELRGRELTKQRVTEACFAAAQSEALVG